MFRYKLRSLLILIFVGPPMLAGSWFVGNQTLSRFLRSGLSRNGSMRCGSRADFVAPPATEQDKLAWEEAKIVSKNLGAPQPVPLPQGAIAQDFRIPAGAR